MLRSAGQGFRAGIATLCDVYDCTTETNDFTTTLPDATSSTSTPEVVVDEEAENEEVEPVEPEQPEEEPEQPEEDPEQPEDEPEQPEEESESSESDSIEDSEEPVVEVDVTDEPVVRPPPPPR